jgi:hypothetical protein
VGGDTLMSDLEERAAAVQALIAAENPGDQAGVVGWLHRLCRAAARALPASGAGVSVMTEGGMRGVAAATDSVSQALEELQWTLGEGPCIDAFASRRPVLEPDLGDRTLSRWPGYVPAAHEHGVRAVFAFPLQVGAARLGVMDVYRRDPGSLSPESLAQALTFAELAVATMLDGQEKAPNGEAATGLDLALDSHHVVYQAQGMTMVDLGVPLTDAMARLRAHAYALDRPLREVARDIVAGRLRLESDNS